MKLLLLLSPLRLTVICSTRSLKDTYNKPSCLATLPLLSHIISFYFKSHYLCCTSSVCQALNRSLSTCRLRRALPLCPSASSLRYGLEQKLQVMLAQIRRTALKLVPSAHLQNGNIHITHTWHQTSVWSAHNQFTIALPLSTTKCASISGTLMTRKPVEALVAVPVSKVGPKMPPSSFLDGVSPSSRVSRRRRTTYVIVVL